jgi:hypothetical protein
MGTSSSLEYPNENNSLIANAVPAAGAALLPRPLAGLMRL